MSRKKVDVQHKELRIPGKYEDKGTLAHDSREAAEKLGISHHKWIIQAIEEKLKNKC